MPSIFISILLGCPGAGGVAALKRLWHDPTIRTARTAMDELIDLSHKRLNFLDVAFVLRPDETRYDAIYDLFNVHIFGLDACEPTIGRECYSYSHE